MQGLFHAERVHHQLELFKNLRGMPTNVGFHSIVPDQLRQVALGDDKVQQLRSVVLLGILWSWSSPGLMDVYGLGDSSPSAAALS